MRFETERFSSSASAASFCFVSSRTVMFSFGFRLLFFFFGLIAIQPFHFFSFDSASIPHTNLLRFQGAIRDGWVFFQTNFQKVRKMLAGFRLTLVILRTLCG